MDVNVADVVATEDVATNYGSYCDEHYGDTDHKPYDELCDPSISASRPPKRASPTKRLNEVSLPKFPTNIIVLPLYMLHDGNKNRRQVQQEERT